MSGASRTAGSGEGMGAATQSAPRAAAFVMFGILLATYTLMSADRYLVSFLGTDIRRALGLTLPQMGALTTMFTLGIGIAGLPAGALIARTSRKLVLLVGVLLFSGATLLFTQATGFMSMFAFIVMQGVGMSFLATSMFALSASYFSGHRVAAVGLVNVCFGLGSFLGPWAIGTLRTGSTNWQTSMVVFGATGIAMALLIAVAVRPWFSETQQAASHGAGTGGADSLLNYNTGVLAVMSALYGLVVYGFLGLYPTFLRDSLHFTPADAGAVMKFFGLGSLTAFFGGQLGDRFSPRVVISVSAIALGALGFFLYRPDLGMGTYKLLALLVGVFGAAIVYTNLAGGHIKALRRSLAGKGSSMFVTSVYAGAALGGFLMGELVDHWGWQVAGRVQISLLSLLVAALAFTLREGEMSR